MSVSASTLNALETMVRPGTPLFGVPVNQLVTLPIAVLYYAAKAQAVTFAPGLKQIQWTGTIDGEPFTAVWHVNRNVAMVAINSSLQVRPVREFFGLLKKATFRS